MKLHHRPDQKNLTKPAYINEFYYIKAVQNQSKI